LLCLENAEYWIDSRLQMKNTILTFQPREPLLDAVLVVAPVYDELRPGSPHGRPLPVLLAGVEAARSAGAHFRLASRHSHKVRAQNERSLAEAVNRGRAALGTKGTYTLTRGRQLRNQIESVSWYLKVDKN